MTTGLDWWVEGTYFEACNCDAVCPCRREGDREGGRSTYGNCDFALSWLIKSGEADDMDLGGFEIVLAGRYDDDEPDSPWRVALYIDERADSDQQHALADTFLGRAVDTLLCLTKKSTRYTRYGQPESGLIILRTSNVLTSMIT
jgi:hypothetical protein